VRRCGTAARCPSGCASSRPCWWRRTIVPQLLTSGDVDDDAWAAAVDTLGEAGAVELTTLVGYYSLLALQMRVLRVPLPDGAETVDFPA
jgi:hypothetical protein